MDFEQIFRDFKAAEAADDFETMSDIIAKTFYNCQYLYQADKVNEIASCSNVLIYQILKLLNDGKGDKAKFYLQSIAVNDSSTYEKYPFLYYLSGRSLYVAGDYADAMKFFYWYEQIRNAAWQDADELSLFYRANCLALLRDFKVAEKIYKQILSIKADFPEVKKNL